MQEKQSRVIIDSDEEIDGGFSCLLEEKETGKNKKNKKLKPHVYKFS